MAQKNCGLKNKWRLLNDKISTKGLLEYLLFRCAELGAIAQRAVAKAIAFKCLKLP
ncbi:hypothetical protein [Nostoc flagelliforme]|nr:hypothetical protein [Nostoc flagelliforme]